jgi:hypothetical protein
LQTLVAEKMKPAPSIVANIEVRARDILISFARWREKEKSHAFVVSSQKKLVAILLICFFQPQPSFGTAAVIITVNKGIIIAVDGSIKHTNSKGETTHYTSECKISKQGSVFYIPVGPRNLPSLGYNIFDITNKAIIKSRSIRDIFGFIEPPILTEIPSIVHYIQVTNPSDYRAMLKGEPVVSVAFATLEDNKPIAAFVEFHVDSEGRPMKPGEKIVAEVPPGGTSLAAMGSSAEINAATADHEWWGRFHSNPIGESEHLIQLEIDASTRKGNHDVGPPISILFISQDLTGTVPGHEGACHY